MAQVRFPVWELRSLFGLNFFSLQIPSGFAAFPFVPFSFAWFLFFMLCLTFCSGLQWGATIQGAELWIKRKGWTILESLFSAFCRDKGIPEWVFQLSVLEKREKEEREEKASQRGWEGRKGRKEMEEWQNKRNTISSVWSAVKPLHSLMSFLYHAFQGKFSDPLMSSFSCPCKISTSNLLEATHRSISHPAVVRVAEGCPPLQWLSFLELWNNPWGALLEIYLKP